MADLSTTFAGIKSPNPFWLASAPPTDKAIQRPPRLRGRLGRRGLEDAGRGRPADRQRQRPALRRAVRPRPAVIGFNNIELITDRPLQLNLDEIREVKRDWPERALVVSLMVPCEEQAWKAILRRSRTPAPTAWS
jgi:dihydropyrimidine dehydrogenase (NAD+) subunit PreA